MERAVYQGLRYSLKNCFSFQGKTKQSSLCEAKIRTHLIHRATEDMQSILRLTFSLWGVGLEHGFFSGQFGQIPATCG